MAVFLTTLLEEDLKAGKVDPINGLCEPFRGWKRGGTNVRLFGKDGPYEAPDVTGGFKLQHVHLRPMKYPVYERWDKAHHEKRWKDKTSDRVLVYFHDADKGDYLLLLILPEGEAHEVVRMKTQEDREFMEDLANIADVWRTSRKIIR